MITKTKDTIDQKSTFLSLSLIIITYKGNKALPYIKQQMTYCNSKLCGVRTPLRSHRRGNHLRGEGSGGIHPLQLLLDQVHGKGKLFIVDLPYSIRVA